MEPRHVTQQSVAGPADQPGIEQADQTYSLGEHVVIAPGVCGGRPTFKGTRIEVQVILDWLRAGRSIDRILEGHPSLSRPAIEEAIALATQALLEYGLRKAA